MRRVLLPATWLVGTLVAMLLAWSSVRLVADQVTERRPSSLSGEAVSRELRGHGPAAATGTVASSPGPSVATQTTAGPGRGVTSTGVPATGATTASRGTTTTSRPAGASARTSTSTTAPTTTSHTYDLRGGSTTIRCDGARISLVWASPKDGFTLEVEKNGPDDVEVRFRSDDHESRLAARCEGGQPVAETREESRGG